MSIRHASKSVVDGLSLSRSSTYICRQCRRNAHPSQLAAQQRQFASERPDDLLFAERVRRKLWKGKPPGPENVDDLYGGPGVLETMYKDRKERRARAKSSGPSVHVPKDAPTESQAPTRAPQGDFVQAPEQEPEARALAPVKQELFAQSKTLKQDVAEDEPDYRKATSWEGLPVIGSTGHWKEEPVNPRDEYFQWLESPMRPEWSYAELASLMHQALVETLAFKETSKGAVQVFRLTADSPIPLAELESATFKIYKSGTKSGIISALQKVTPLNNISEQDAYVRRVPKPDLKVKYSIREQEAMISRTEPVMTPLQPRLLYTPTDTTFLDATLDFESKMTATILKRFSYLTNHTIPDPILNDLASAEPTQNTIRTFLTNMAEKVKRKPAKVAEQLLHNEVLAKQSNLLVLGRRETPVDKEKELGRWKVIEQELRERGLPVLGKLTLQR